MKQKFVMTGKGEALTVKVTVEIEGDKFELTADEQRAVKVKLQNQTHALLRERGYDVSEIKLS